MGITGCPDWQRRAVLQLDAIGSPAVVLNPRREHFPVGQADATQEQVAWEYEHLRLADVILFWFCAEAVQPVALFELGAHAARGTRLAVGAHPEYPRRLDVLEQLRHARPDVTVHDSLRDTVHGAAAHLPAKPTPDRDPSREGRARELARSALGGPTSQNAAQIADGEATAPARGQGRSAGSPPRCLRTRSADPVRTSVPRDGCRRRPGECAS